MIFPIGDDQVRGGYFPLFSYALIAANALAFYYQLQRPDFGMEYSAIPIEILNGRNWITLLTSMFLHGGWAHIIGNMVFLWIFADNVESSVGNIRFLTFYLLGGVVAAMAHIIANPGSMIPTVGASGAISAVMGAYLVMFPRSRVTVLLFFLFIRVPAILFLGFWIGQQVVSSMYESVPVGGEGGGVAWMAHIGGFVFGVIYGLYSRSRYDLAGRLEGENEYYYD